MTERDRELIERAAIDVTAVTIAYCSVFQKHFDNVSSGTPAEIAECLKDAQDGLRALGHASGAIERLRRVLQGEYPGVALEP